MEGILGQPAAVRTLQTALDSGRVHHAWIFHGPRGVGKFTAAIEFAKALLDPDAMRDLMGHVRADRASRIARLIESGNHPDLHIIRKEMCLDSTVPHLRTKRLTNIPIDLVREHMIGGVTLDEKSHAPIVYHTSQLGHGKVFIIDEAELLAHGQNEAQNAILKTLEEPPPRTYLILVTTQIDKLRPTIRSRCQRVAFTTLDREAMAEWFERSGLKLSAEERAWIERFADGSPGLAKMAVEDDLRRWEMRIAGGVRAMDRGAYPPGLGDELADLVDSFAIEWVKQHENASKEMANRDGAERIFLILSAHVRNRLRQTIDAGDEARPWLDVIDVIRETEIAINANVNIKQALENLVVQWTDVMAGGVRVGA